MKLNMHDDLTELARRGKALPPDARSRLIDLLLESMNEPAIAEVGSAWDVEIERRLAEYSQGDTTSIDAEAVFAKARHIAR